MAETYERIARAVGGHGLVLRGWFLAAADDAVPPVAAGRPTRAVVMIGNTGHAMWDAFTLARPAGDNPLDSWTRSAIGPIARAHGATVVYPSDVPPLPFQRWARRAWPVHPSPLGLLIDPEFGLWHALRAALLFDRVLALPTVPAQASPCDRCTEQPCLSACPVAAFSADGFDYRGCRRHLANPAGADCLADGCRARAACPVGRDHRYVQAQQHFHQHAFSGLAKTPP